MAAQLTGALGKVEKDARSIEDRVQAILAGLQLDGPELQAFAAVLREQLATMFLDGAHAAAEQVPVAAPPAVPPVAAAPVLPAAGAGPLAVRIGVDAFAVVNKAGLEYARQRAAEMVGMRWVGGKLVPNPDAQWRIDEGTREMLRADVTRAMEGGWSNDRLARAVRDNHAFSEARADTIARTETARADVEGNLAGYESLGVERKEWLTAPECCPECKALNGKVVAMKAAFPGGVNGPPAHPNCRCAVLPVLDDDE